VPGGNNTNELLQTCCNHAMIAAYQNRRNIMAVEAKRGCGYRKVGGLYLVGGTDGIACDRLPIAIEICRCCGQGIKQSRGWSWIDIAGLVGGDHKNLVQSNSELTGPITTEFPCRCGGGVCPLCHNVAAMGRGGLIWVGTQFYPTIEAFEAEARAQGISRRIAAIPRGFKLGDVVLFAHPRGVLQSTGELTGKYVPAIFRVWRPTRLERIFDESKRGSDEVAASEKRGETPVFVPDNDADHHGSVYSKPEPKATEPTLKFDSEE
jgi:hypothetical protein